MGWQYLVHGASVALVCSVPSFTDLGTSFADHPIRKLKSLQLLTCAVNPVYLRSSDQCWFGRRAVTEGRQVALSKLWPCEGESFLCVCRVLWIQPRLGFELAWLHTRP